MNSYSSLATQWSRTLSARESESKQHSPRVVTLVSLSASDEDELHVDGLKSSSIHQLFGERRLGGESVAAGHGYRSNSTNCDGSGELGRSE